MTKILKSRYKEFKKTGVRFNARRSKLKFTLNKRNLRIWNSMEFKKAHKRSRHPKFNDTLWRLNFKNKQEIKAFYGGISELTYQRLNKNINKSAFTHSNLGSLKKSPSQLIGIFETRLDVVVFKLHWALSIYHAKQLISHGHIQVNGKKIKTPSYILRPNDLIQVSSNPQSRRFIRKIVIKKLAKINAIINLIYFRRLPFYLGGITNLKNKFEYWLFLPLSLEVDYLTMSATLVLNNASTPVSFPLTRALRAKGPN